MDGQIQSPAGRGGDICAQNNQEPAPVNKSGKSHATVVHVTASSVSNQDVSRHPTSTLLGMDSLDILHDYKRLFCPELGSSESDSLGIVSYTDGAKGAYVDSQGVGPLASATQSLAHGIDGGGMNTTFGGIGESMGGQFPQQSLYQSTASSASSTFGNMGGHRPAGSVVMPGIDRTGSGVGGGGLDQHLHVRTTQQRVEGFGSNPPLSWAMRVSSPRPGWQQDGSVSEGSSVLGEKEREGEEFVPELFVGLDGQYESYCRQIITPALNSVTTVALERLRNIQQEIETSMLGQPGVTKATIPRKYFCSLKEVSKVAKICKLLVVAPDIKPSQTAHIKPVKMLNALIEDAASAGVPYVFALSRRGIGQIFGKDKNMSIMALMDLDPIRAEVEEMLAEARVGRQLWLDKARNEGRL